MAHLLHQKIGYKIEGQYPLEGYMRETPAERNKEKILNL